MRIAVAIFALYAEVIAKHTLCKDVLDIMFHIKIASKSVTLIVKYTSTERRATNKRRNRRFASCRGMRADCTSRINSDTIADK